MIYAVYGHPTTRSKYKLAGVALTPEAAHGIAEDCREREEREAKKFKWPTKEEYSILKMQGPECMKHVLTAEQAAKFETLQETQECDPKSSYSNQSQSAAQTQRQQ